MGDWFEKVTIGATLDRAVVRFRTREALTFAGRRWSFQDLQADCDRAARELMQYGVQPGEKVSLWLPNRPEWLPVPLRSISAILGGEERQ